MKRSEWNEAMNQIDTDLVDNFMLQQQEIHQRKRKKVLCLRFGMVAACFLLVFAAFAGYLVFGGDQSKVAATIMLDVNPSLEIKVDENERVLEVVPLNEDAKIVVGDRDFKNIDLAETVRILVDSIIEHGYIDEASKAVLLSVDGKTSAEADAIRAKLTEQIMSQLGEDAIVIGQNVTKEEDTYPHIRKIMEDHGISLGKASVVYELVSSYHEYSTEDLVNLSISHLSILLHNNGNFDITGTIKEMIGYEAALEKAMEAYQWNETNNIVGVTVISCVSSNQLVYYVEMKEKTPDQLITKRCDINANTGEIIDSDSHGVEYTSDSSIISRSIFEAITIACDDLGISPDDGYMLSAKNCLSIEDCWQVKIANVDNKDYTSYIVNGKIIKTEIRDRLKSISDPSAIVTIYKDYTE